MHVDDLTLTSRTVGALPILRHFYDRLGLESLLEVYVPARKLGRGAGLSHARALSGLITNVLLSREPLYAVPAWLQGHTIDVLGLTDVEAELFNDDRIGRALDRLYETDPASLLTAVITRAVREFCLDLDQIHNDTTTVTFSGDYDGQKDKSAKKRPPLITFGHNKDHRPDLKQLVYALTVSADGAVPVHYKTYDGNVTDDQTHRDTWSTVRLLAGRADFMYVADSKLCTHENMMFIHERGGRFLTVLPRSRKEDDDFREYLQEHAIPWDEVFRKKARRKREKPDLVYHAFESPTRSAEGFRVVWYRSSIKTTLDAKRRTQKIRRARARIEQLEGRTGAHRFRSADAAQKAADEALHEEGVTRWLRVTAAEDSVPDLKKNGPGRPGTGSTYTRVDIPIILFHVEDDVPALQADARCDGLFAMVTNDETSTPRQLLDMYKYQPFLEKRNEQLKSVLAVAPVFLKKPERVAALLLVYFLAVLILALIERALRQQMRERGIRWLPLYPEARPCKAPTTEVIFRAFEGVRRHCLVDPKGQVLRTFHDPLSPVAKTVLDLLGVKRTMFGS